MKDRAKAIENQVQKHKHDIAKGLAATWAVSKVIEAWRDTAPNRLWTRQEAADWVRIHVPFDSALLGTALRDLWATGAVIGSDAADHALAVAGAADESVRITTSFDWSRWSPGNREAALIANPKGGFADRLASRNVVLKGIDKTTADRIGTVLSRGLEDGLTPSIVSTDVAGELIDSRTEWATTLEDRLQQVQDDFSRAETIARTEMNQAVADEVMNRYDELGVTQVQWNVIDPCDTCDSLDGQVVAFGEPFIADTKNGEVEILQPVVHPNCNCFLTPVIDDGSASADNMDSVDMVDSADLEMSAKALIGWVLKFNENHDESGRFASSDGSGGNAEATSLKQGTDLTDKIKIDSLPSKPSEGEHRDQRLEAIAKAQGFDGPAQTITKDELAKLDNPTIFYRGVSPYVDDNGKLISNEEIQKQFVSGDYFAGLGTAGNGIYWTTDRVMAETYAESKPNGYLMTAVLDPSSTVASNDERKDARTTTGDPSATLALKGFDGAKGTNFGNDNRQIYVMYNRTALKVVTND